MRQLHRRVRWIRTQVPAAGRVSNTQWTRTSVSAGTEPSSAHVLLKSLVYGTQEKKLQDEEEGEEVTRLQTDPWSSPAASSPPHPDALSQSASLWSAGDLTGNSLIWGCCHLLEDTLSSAINTPREQFHWFISLILGLFQVLYKEVWISSVIININSCQ